VFTIVKIQRTNSVIYLLEDYRGKSVAGAFYEHELHCATHPCILWTKYCIGKEIRCTSNGWDLMDRTIHGYTKTMSFDKILIRVFLFLHIKNISI